MLKILSPSPTFITINTSINALEFFKDQKLNGNKLLVFSFEDGETDSSIQGHLSFCSLFLVLVKKHRDTRFGKSHYTVA